jgi:hypothetical protein
LVPGWFPLRGLIEAFFIGRRAEIFPGGRPRLRFGARVFSTATVLRGRPRERLVFAKALTFCVCFAFRLGGRPRFSERCGVALARFFAWPEVFDFFAKTICS